MTWVRCLPKSSKNFSSDGKQTKPLGGDGEVDVLEVVWDANGGVSANFKRSGWSIPSETNPHGAFVMWQDAHTSDGASQVIADPTPKGNLDQCAKEVSIRSSVKLVMSGKVGSGSPCSPLRQHSLWSHRVSVEMALC